MKNRACPRCNGVGKVEEFGLGWRVIDVIACPACEGTGRATQNAATTLLGRPQYLRGQRLGSHLQ
jgi:DnaJ-class molecular chaperone